ncbi:MAG: hypothetical protein RID09_15905 [Coleofasciculus sp. G1-WW12-02]|uniref:hypothetical protein n=1 Tax=unclassified Coleofasciculus TaxID=2692782 RepID=UPI0032FF2C4D
MPLRINIGEIWDNYQVRSRIELRGKVGNAHPTNWMFRDTRLIPSSLTLNSLGGMGYIEQDYKVRSRITYFFHHFQLALF